VDLFAPFATFAVNIFLKTSNFKLKTAAQPPFVALSRNKGKNQSATAQQPLKI
jgi:hypothetical protein